MASSYKFAIIRFAPDQIRGEQINIGALIFSESGVDLRATRRLDRVKAISAAINSDVLVRLFQNVRHLDELARRSGVTDVEARFQNLANIGPLLLSRPGSFIAENASAYEDRVEALLQKWVEPEPAPKRTTEKRTRLFAAVKKVFRRERILARTDESLDSHRVVAAYQLADGLVADLVLRNGAYHVIETVDASGDGHALRRTISEIALSALVLERARMRFGTEATKARLVFSASPALERVARPSLDAAEHQGAELINWDSGADRAHFVNSISSMATPLLRKRKSHFVAPVGGGLFQ